MMIVWVLLVWIVLSVPASLAFGALCRTSSLGPGWTTQDDSLLTELLARAEHLSS